MGISKNQDQPSSQEKKVLLSVIIATYNGHDYIDRCLESFTRQSIESNVFEVIIVNNNSTDDTNQIVLKYVNQFDYYFLLEENNPGVSYARNKGIRHAKGKYICFIDDDAYADENWLKNVLLAFQNISPKPAVVGGRILPYYTTKKPEWFYDFLEIRTKGNDAKFLSKSECYSGFPESNYSVRKDVLEEVGYFSTDLGPKGEKMKFGEGSELSRRIAEKYPYFWYDPDIFVYHLVRERNMSIRYYLSRIYKTGFLYQALRAPENNFFKNLFVLSSCIIRILLNALLSIVFVRWFTKKAKSDWLKHTATMVSCIARGISIIKYYFNKNITMILLFIWVGLS